MSTATETRFPVAGSPGDPFRYGWRFVKKLQPDGTETLEQVPLTLEDTLHPEEGDFIVENLPHHEDAHYLYAVLRTHLRDRPGVLVCGDCRVDWGSTEIRAHGPDIAVIAGCEEQDPFAGTIYIGQLGAQPLLAIEITSPDRPDNDLVIKVDHYYRVGVPFYAIVDGRVRKGKRLIELIGYRPGPTGYDRVELDERGWLWLETVDLWLAAENGHVVCYKADGEPCLDYTQSEVQREAAIERADLEAERAVQAVKIAKREKSRAEREKARAEQETARADTEKGRAESEKARAIAVKALAESEKARADTEKALAESEKARADSEKARADREAEIALSEKARADAAVARLLAAEVELRRLRGET